TWRTTSAHALVCQPQAIQSALLARNARKPISRRRLCVEATSHAAPTVTAIAGHCTRSSQSIVRSGDLHRCRHAVADATVSVPPRLRRVRVTVMQHLASSPLARLSLLVVLVAGCATPPPEQPPPSPQQPAAPAPAPAARPAPTPPLVAAPFADAVARAGDRLLQDATAALGTGPRELVIDPLIDANTGQQTNSTVQMGGQLAGLITRRVPTWNVQALTRSALAAKPLLLIG